MFAASFISAFGLSNYLTGLKAENMQNFIQMPTNIKIYILYHNMQYSCFPGVSAFPALSALFHFPSLEKRGLYAKFKFSCFFELLPRIEGSS